MPTRQELPVNFVEGLHTICGAGNSNIRHGVAIHVYMCNASMKDSGFYNADGDFLIGIKKYNCFLFIYHDNLNLNLFITYNNFNFNLIYQCHNWEY